MTAQEWLEGYEHRDATTNGEDLAADIIRAQQERIERLERDAKRLSRAYGEEGK